MTDRIEISLADCKRVSELLGNDWGDNPVAAVMEVLRAYNRFVGADPVGTIRLGSDGRIAIRVQNLDMRTYISSNAWVHVSTKTGIMARPDKDVPDAYDSWPVIYSPESQPPSKALFRALSRDLKRLTESNQPYDDQARDLLGSYDITPKPEV